MAQGLGKNAAVKLQLTRQNYEALILRHGQWVRWRVGEKCTCLLNSGRVDPSCNKCGGDGWLYSFQRKRDVIAEPLVRVTPTIHRFDLVPGIPSKIRRVYDGNTEYQATLEQDYIITQAVGKEVSLFADAEVSNVQAAESYAEYEGNNRLFVFSAYKKTELGNIYGDITEVNSVENVSNGETYTVSKFYRNYIEIEDPVIPIQSDDVILASYDYLAPFRMVILSQTKNRSDQVFMEREGGDAILIFPNEYDISNGDIITSLIAWTKRKEVITHRTGATDRIPEYFINSVQSISTTDTDYVSGIDFILEPPNTIRWLTAPPADGTKMSVSFYYHPTYRVLREFPNVRSSEDKLLPRRVALKLLNTGGKVSVGLY